jgi:hypothetical protein
MITPSRKVRAALRNQPRDHAALTPTTLRAVGCPPEVSLSGSAFGPMGARLIRVAGRGLAFSRLGFGRGHGVGGRGIRLAFFGFATAEEREPIDAGSDDFVEGDDGKG